MPQSPKEKILERAHNMISPETTKPRLSWPERLQTAGLILVFLVGGVGGGGSFYRSLSHFGVPDFLSGIILLVYWSSFCILASKIQLRPDTKTNYEQGFSDGYSAGHEEGLSIVVSAKQRSQYDSGYQQGLSDGRSDGFSQGYEAAQRDTRE